MLTSSYVCFLAVWWHGHITYSTNEFVSILKQLNDLFQMFFSSKMRLLTVRRHLQIAHVTKKHCTIRTHHHYFPNMFLWAQMSFLVSLRHPVVTIIIIKNRVSERLRKKKRFSKSRGKTRPSILNERHIWVWWIHWLHWVPWDFCPKFQPVVTTTTKNTTGSGPEPSQKSMTTEEDWAETTRWRSCGQSLRVDGYVFFFNLKEKFSSWFLLFSFSFLKFIFDTLFIILTHVP